MDAKDADPADEWPLPPVWMWECRDCVVLYKAMKRAPEIVDAARRELGPGVDCDPMDSILSTQIRLAEHIAARHPDDVPAVDEACATCVSDVGDARLPASLVLRHRARHLFVPPSIVGSW
ncbi:hypothetical protein [Actinacidiphila yeochonensis]|uniref:hypothetical protein n=1 Tax=Actinacidiphila yeochonensis TaxID=89050 RepID=UPI00099BC018|nr:hypothetical protein [Actinacidiphila yeochonensis]